MDDEVRDFLLPKLVAVEIERRGVDGVPIQKRDKQPLTIASRRRGRVRTLLVSAPDEAAFVHRLCPDQVARSAIETEQRLHFLLFVGRVQVDPIAHDNRRTMPAAGNRRFPDDVLTVAPLRWGRLIRRRMPVARGSAPPGPVIGGETEVRRRARHRRLGFGPDDCRGQTENQEPCQA
jgi:hypothetical protein